MKILITGTAGFIGFHAVEALLHDGHEIWGLDVINDYYDTCLKWARLAQHGISEHQVAYNQPLQSVSHSRYTFLQLALEDGEALIQCFRQQQFDAVIHLAAQAGLKNCFDNSGTYVQSNLVGFHNILEACRLTDVQHLVFASSSSVYGLNEGTPFSENDDTNHPASLYGASKKANEMMAHSYAHLFGLPVTGTRFFTVYGPWGRPDMVCSKFADAILDGRAIRLHGNGHMWRDFTFVADIVEALRRIVLVQPTGNPNWNAKQPEAAISAAPYRIYNVGSNYPVLMNDFLDIMEELLGCQAVVERVPVQPGEIAVNHADVTALGRDFGFVPQTDIRHGLTQYVDWFRKFYGK